jgi:hypothetical protein
LILCNQTEASLSFMEYNCWAAGSSMFAELNLYLHWSKWYLCRKRERGGGGGGVGACVPLIGMWHIWFQMQNYMIWLKIN